MLERLINFNSAAEGASILPRQVGDNRVPPVTRLQIRSIEPDVGGNRVTLTWENSQVFTSNGTRYNIYAAGVIPGTTALSGPFTFSSSPAIIVLPCNSPAQVTFYCQTQLASGFATKLENCPTVAALLKPPVLYATSSDLRYPQYNQQAVGVASLSGGLATITTPVVTASSRILLSRQTLGSSPGHLYVGTKTPYTSFEIASSDPGDNGDVFYLVLNPVA